MSQTYSQIIDEIQRLEIMAADARRSEVQAGIADIKRIMSECGLTREDVAKALKGPSARSAGTTAPKYRHPSTGETWTGRGPTPRWMAALLSTGASRDDLLI